jgi:hypothetical protein
MDENKDFRQFETKIGKTTVHCFTLTVNRRSTITLKQNSNFIGINTKIKRTRPSKSRFSRFFFKPLLGIEINSTSQKKLKFKITLNILKEETN